MDNEMAKFTFDTIILGVGTAMGKAVQEKELTEPEAQAGMDRVIENIEEMLMPTWRDAFRHHLSQMHGDIPQEVGGA